MADSEQNMSPPVAIVAIAGWVLPGAGYWLTGERSRAIATGVTVILLYLAGLLIGGVRVIEVPGFGDAGQQIQVRTTNGVVWVMSATPMQEIKAKPWSIAQILAGPMGIFSGVASVYSAQSVAVSHTPVNEAGTLYTAVAGMLNLLVIIDSTHRAAQKEST